jgi:N-hydroxyarylamine O-acetyltransferase
VFDLDAYLDRIGLSGRPSVAAVHRAHSSTIPFENLDPYGGAAVSLAIEDIQRKLVGQRRGGYCFEQNLLLAAALEALGADVELLLARTRFGAAPGAIRPRSHLVLRVSAEDAVWHADVGYGMGTLFEPLPFGAGAEHEQSGWRFRVVGEGAELVLQAYLDDGWVDLYIVPPDPVPLVDVEAINWWACTSPRSPFVNGLVLGFQHDDGTRVSLRGSTELVLVEQSPASTSSRKLGLEQLGEVLASSFTLMGVWTDENGRPRIFPPTA